MRAQIIAQSHINVHSTIMYEKDSRLCEGSWYYLERTNAGELSRGIIYNHSEHILSINGTVSLRSL